VNVVASTRIARRKRDAADPIPARGACGSARILIAAVLLASATPLAAQAPPLRPGDVVFRGGWLFDAVRDDVVRNTGILVRSGKLLEVGVDLTGRDLSAGRIVDLGDDEYILPGLFDLHAHYAMDLFSAGRIDELAAYPLLFLANGVTSTFPAGEMDPVKMREARLKFESGEWIGPRLHNSGPYYGSARPGWNPEAMTEDSIRREIDYWAAQGVRGLKAKGISPTHLLPVIDQAHKHGLTVTGHLDSGARSSVNPRDAILMGIDRIEHFMGGDAITSDRSAYQSLEVLDVTRPEVRRIIDLYISHNVRFDATLSAYGYYGKREPAVYEYWVDEKSFLTPYMRQVLEARPPRRVNEQFERIYHVKRKEVKAFFDGGGGHLITLGTDHPSWGEFFSGFGSHRELHSFVLAGIPPAAALKIGTINGARALGLSDRLGTIEAGKLADLFVVRGNPLQDIRNTRNVRLVMKAGTLYEAEKLLEQAKGKIGPSGPDDEARWKPTPREARGRGSGGDPAGTGW
jgi:imidazolonepropionase-like amidohydrolase